MATNPSACTDAAQPWYATREEACQGAKSVFPSCDRYTAVYRNYVATLIGQSCKVTWEYQNLGNPNWGTFGTVIGLQLCSQNALCSAANPPPPPPPPPTPPTPLGCVTGAGGFSACLPDTGVPPSVATLPPGTPNGGGPNPNSGPPGEASSPDTAGDTDAQQPSDPSSGGGSCSRVEAAGNPIFVATGNKFQEETDYRGPRGLEVVRRYNSSLPGWVHNYGVRVFADATSARVIRPDGRAHVYTGNGPGAWVGEAAAREQLFRLAPANSSQPLWKYVTATQSTEWYDADGRLVSIARRGGATFGVTQSGGLLRSIRDPFGNGLQFAYDGQNRLVSVTTPEGTVIAYGYDAQGRLTQVTYPDGSTRGYLYENSAYPLALTGLVDERGVRYATWAYDSAGRAVASEHAGGVQRYQLSFNADGSASVTDPLNFTRTQSYLAVGTRKVFSGQSQPCAGCTGDAASTLADPASGLLSQSIDYLAITTLFTNDSQRKLPLTVTQAAGRPEQRQRTIEWHPTFRLPTLVTETGRTTTYTYDALGNMLSQTVTDLASGQARTTQWTYTAQGMVETQADPKGALWRYGYDSAGNRTSVINPIGQQTTFGYDGAGHVTRQTDPNGLVNSFSYDARGRLTSQVRGGDAISYSYTPTGQLASATQPTGYQVSYNYDAAQRLVGAADNRGAQVQYTLDAMGNRVREEVRDASGAIALVTGRVINSLNRVAALQGSLGQTTTLAYDANGEPVAQTDPLNQTTRQSLDGLRRPVATTFADNASATQSWNQLDQLTRVTDPKGVATGYQVNAFGEVMQETNPDIGAMSYQRDANGEVTAVTDAVGNTTALERDQLGRPTVIQYAPDQVAALRYDQGQAGYLAQIDDRSGTTAFERDALGRIVSKTQAVNDNPANPSRYKLQYGYSAGELASVTYPSGLKLFYRRAAGRIIGIDAQEPSANPLKPKPVIPFVSNLAYTALGQARSWNWSSGDSAARTFDTDGRMTATEFSTYSWDAASRITGIGQNLWASRTVGKGKDATTELYTTPLAWSAGYDNRNRLTSLVRGGAETRYSYDANSNRLSAIDQVTSDTDLDGIFEADDFTLTTSQALALDAASNRLLGFTQTITKTRADKTRSVVSTPVTYSIDANGALTSDGLRTFDYDAARRLSKVQILKDGEAAKVSYLHNALGQRVFKSEITAAQTHPDENTLGTSFVDWLRKNFHWLFTPAQANTSIGTAFMYGDGEIPAWALIGEYDNGSSSGKGGQEYIWLPTEDGQAVPIGIYRNGRFFAVHTDHLGTPRLITDESSKPVWQWPYSAFGNNKPSGILKATPNPKAATTNQPVLLKATNASVEVNLRFPGQYFDEESNLSYNYFRSYNAGQGRYSQADPIGLDGGLNRFAYAENTPSEKVDPLGLATYMCTQPLHALGAAGRLIYSPGRNPLHHQFLAIIDLNGATTTGGQDREKAPWGPGKPSEGDGADGSGAECKKVEDDNQCIETCLKGKFSLPRPKYSLLFSQITGGQNCQGWSADALQQCQAQCRGKR